MECRLLSVPAAAGAEGSKGTEACPGSTHTAAAAAAGFAGQGAGSTAAPVLGDPKKRQSLLAMHIHWR